MDVIVCLDDKGGMLFNKRRQSRDSAVFEDMKSYLFAPLAIDAFSEKLIAETGIDYEVKVPEKEDVFFLENIALDGFADKIDRVIIYKWNRVYPSDFKFSLDLAKEGFLLKETKDIVGTSHEKITREVYAK